MMHSPQIDLPAAEHQGAARVAAAVRAWAMEAEISTPPLDWARLGAILDEHLTEQPSAADQVTVPKPTFGTETHHAAQFLVDAAWKLRNGYTPGGSTVTGGIAQLLENVAARLDPSARTTYDGHAPAPYLQGEEVHITELTYEQRQALPAIYHRPVFYDLTTPPAGWVCAVCWADDLLTGWPCRPATAGGIDLAKHLGLEFTR